MPKRRKKLPRNGLKIIEQMASRGCREVDIAAGLNMCWQTFDRIRKEREDVQLAMEAGNSICHDKILGTLYRKATEENDTIAAMFLLKTRFGYKEGYVLEKTSNIKISFDMPAALPAAHYERLINPPEQLSNDDG